MTAPTALGVVRRWGEMVKFSHTVFALPFALMATFLAARSAFLAGDAAGPWPRWGQGLLIVACMVTARSAAMTFNRLVDATIDARNPRTAARAIPAGTISRNQARLFLGLSSMLFVVGCGGFSVFYGNRLPLRLSIPVLLYLCFYSYTKRLTRWSHFVLGSAIAFAPVAAWIAIHPASVGWPAIVLMAAVTLWIGGFDIIYACQDLAFDRAAGLFSLPARMGPGRALRLARAAHAATVVLLAVLAPLLGLGGWYLLGVALVGVLLLYENLLVRADDFSRVNLAFFTVNGVISLILAALTIADIGLRTAR